jgi:oxygen-independent coproporphyrinogen-3 oxidase
MAGIYIHIPFCRKACTYCDFHFSTSTRTKAPVLAAMRREMTQRLPQSDEPIGSIYFGGGTPSLLDPGELADFMRIAHDLRHVDAAAEITLESNPDDVTLERIDAWRDLGINRISLGVQSFREDRLRWMGRAHNALQALRSIELIAQAGFYSWSIDLIYGLPDMSMSEWDEQLGIALDHGMPHLSAYCLTVETRTALAHQVDKRLVHMPDDAATSAQFDRLIDRMEGSGLEHYEVSNFARHGHRAVHNSAYWRGVPYIGIGPSAHSFDGRTRRWNVAHNLRYAHALERGERYWDEEHPTAAQRTNERLLTGLRTAEGVALSDLEIDAVAANRKAFERHRTTGMLDVIAGRLVLTRAGRHFADRIASDLFVIADDR